MTATAAKAAITMTTNMTTIAIVDVDELCVVVVVLGVVEKLVVVVKVGEVGVCVVLGEVLEVTVNTPYSWKL